MIVSSTSPKFSASYNELDMRSKRTRSQTVFSFDTGKLDTWLLAKSSTLQLQIEGLSTGKLVNRLREASTVGQPSKEGGNRIVRRQQRR